MPEIIEFNRDDIVFKQFFGKYPKNAQKFVIFFLLKLVTQPQIGPKKKGGFVSKDPNILWFLRQPKLHMHAENSTNTYTCTNTKLWREIITKNKFI